jgi:serine phosphatase RsbU (regulator of sigma subunit)
MLMHKISLPIYLKLVFFILLILGISLSSYIYYAVNIFKDDKVSYVFNSLDEYNKQNALFYKERINSLLEELKRIDKLDFSGDFLLSYLSHKRNILGHYEFREKKLKHFISLQGLSLAQNELQKILQYKKENVFVDKGMVYIQKIYTDKLIGFVVKTREFFESETTQLYENEFLNLNADLSRGHKELKKRLEAGVTGKTFVLNSPYPVIISARKLFNGFYFVTKTPYEKALKASEFLVKNSLFFALLVAGLTIMVVLLMSSWITKPINSLAKLAGQFLESNFKVRSTIKSSDEIGVLAYSFNKMADDINIYMGQMQEKFRLEEEIKTAQLVQTQFFPQSEVSHEKYFIKSFYKSATECAGDWWGNIQTSDQTILVIADVTGHGTPAALMTAVLHSALIGLKNMSKVDKNFLASPQKIMNYLNSIFCQSSQNLNATAFVGILNHHSLEFCYANASHSAPLLLDHSIKNPTKNDLKPLLENLSPRLGESDLSVYKSASVLLKPQDRLIFYTDGIIEAENSDRKKYGQRRFLKTILNSKDKNIADVIALIKADFETFYDKEQLDDDFTLIGLDIL